MTHLRPLRYSIAILATASALACASSPSVPATPSSVSAPATLLSASDRYFMSGDVRLRYRDIGQGEPVVLIHGLARSLDDWTGVADSLALDHRVVALDVRGFGKSTRVSEPGRLGIEMAHDVVRLLDHLGIRRAHLAGHSMGATIAAKVAALHPDRVGTVALLAGPFFDDSTSFAKDEQGLAADVEQGRGMKGLLRWLFPMFPDSVVAALDAEAMSRNDPRTVGAAMRSMGALTVLPSTAGTVRAPAVVVVGGGDPLLPQSRWIASWWPNARLVELADANHITVLHHPETLRAMRAVMRAAPSR